MVVRRPQHRFTVEEFERLIEADVFAPDLRVELIHGAIVEMSAIGGPHNACVNRTNRFASQRIASDYYVQVQGPIRLPEYGEPVPDLAIVRVGYDERRPPEAADVLLVVEVSDSTLRFDRGTKLPIYAAAGITEAWIFNLNARRLERYSEPGPDGYRAVAYAEASQRFESTVLPILVFVPDELFGPQESGGGRRSADRDRRLRRALARPVRRPPGAGGGSAG
jgi:Uma2 family endonuclease